MTTADSHYWTQQAKNLCFDTRAFIDGDYRKQNGSDMFYTENPATGHQLAEFTDGGAVTVDTAVAAATAAFPLWRKLAPEARKACLFKVANAIEQAAEDLALRDSLEMGKPIAMALEEAASAASYIRYYAELLDKIQGDIAPSDQTTTLGMSLKEPRGVVGIISPWNFPLLTAIAAVAPALAAGNTLVLKPSELTPSSALKLADIASEAGLPDGVLNVVPGTGINTGAALARHQDIHLLHFTGSVPVGRQLMVYAGQSNGKPLMLELGGKSPQIVFDDAADLPNLGATLAQAAFYNSGQLCVARTRLLVQNSIKDQVLEALMTQAQNVFRVGDPLDPETTFGPLVSSRQRKRVMEYTDIGQQEGAALCPVSIAGTAPETGQFIDPVIFNNVDQQMRIVQEEIFGPVLSVMGFDTEQDAIALANEVDYGLAATAWTRDLGRARRLGRDLNVGGIEIYSTTAPATPAFMSEEPCGASGFGVMGGVRGMEGFMRQKAVQFFTE